MPLLRKAATEGAQQIVRTSGIKPRAERSGSMPHTTPFRREKMADRDENEQRGAAHMNRRGMLKCMTWAGTGVLWSVSGGVPRTLGLLGEAHAAEPQASAFTFLPISDSHA